MLYGSAQTRSSELDRGALPMSATDAAATHIAPVSLTRVKCMVLPVDPAEDDGSAKDTTPGAGAGSLRLRVATVLRAAPASRQAEPHQRTARVAHIGVIAERADRPECGGRIFRTDAERHAGARPAPDAREHGDVLLAVRPRVSHRVADDAPGQLDPPQLRAGPGFAGL